MWPTITNMLSWWQWLIMAAVPPLIILLYFLKLKRRPLEVPSTYLWHKSIEDLHVNAIWQRLRRNLLLFLQLLVILLAMLALLGLSWQKRQLSGDRFIFLVDNSASMQATDLGESRLEDAKRKVLDLIDQMKSGDAAMVISFADTPQVMQNFSDDRRLLRQRVEAIEPTTRPTSLREALKVASGLANPGHVGENFQFSPDMVVDLFIFSDGNFDPVSGFSLGNLKPVFVPIGDPAAANVGIMAFDVRPSEADPELYQAFARLENFGGEEVDVDADLYRYVPGGSEQDHLLDAYELTLPAGEARGVAFDLGSVESGVLELRLKAHADDHLAVDDRAWTIVSPPRPARVLLATPGNDPLRMAMTTDSLEEIAEVTVESPDFLKSKEYAEKALGGGYDLVVFDRCRPQRLPQAQRAEMPQANTLFIGSLPPEHTGWSAKERVQVYQFLPVATPHPLMQWIDLRDVRVADGTPLKPPPGGSTLIDSVVGPMLAIAPREGFEDAVLGFVLVDEVTADGKTEQYIGTDWMAKQSFPVFVLNMFDYLGGGRELGGSGSVQPGKPVILEAPTPQARLRVHTPAGGTFDLKGGKLGKFNFTDTGELGPYDVRCQGKTVRRFAVNLFDAAESAIRPDPQPVIQIGYVEVEGRSGWEAGRRDIWRWLLLLGLAVLLLEWYIYNRRVYL